MLPGSVQTRYRFRINPNYNPLFISDIWDSGNYGGSHPSNYSECVSHSPVYLPRQACNTVSPSLLRFLAPGHISASGLFIGVFLVVPLHGQELFQLRTRLLFAEAIERREVLHGRYIAKVTTNLE